MRSWARAAFLFLFCAVMFCEYTAQAQQYPIVELVAEGSQRYSADDILAYTGLKVDKQAPVTLRRVEEAAQKLAASGVFDKVGYEHIKAPGGMKVTFTVDDQDDSQFVPVDFQNIVWFSDREIRDEVRRRIPLFYEKTALAGDLSSEIAEVVQAMLAEKGIHGHVSANPATSLAAGGEVVRIALDDVQVLIAEVDTPGVPADCAQGFADAAKKLAGTPFLRRAVQLFAEEDLMRVLLRQGHLRASFGAITPEVVSNEAGITRVKVSVPVQPGLTYKFDGAKWDGSPFLSPIQLEKFLHLKAGVAVDGDQLKADLNRVRLEHIQHGYMKAQVKSEPEFDDAAGTVRYALHVEAGTLYSMGKLEVEGFKAEIAEQLHLAWKLREGDPFDEAYLQGFLKTLHIPGVNDFAIEKSEGDTPNTMDVTIVACLPGSNCKDESPAKGKKDPQ